MGFFKKYAVETLLFLTVVLFFLLRFYNILQVPIFTDEAIYLRWAQIARDDASWRFISLVDGKQPSYIWLTLISMKIFEDPLFAGRSVSVFAGFFTMIGLFFTGRELFKSKWIGFIASFLYLIYPMAFVYDRMALYDSLVAMFSVWSLFLTILLARHVRLDIALILGMVTGGAVLTKTNGFATLYLLPFSLLLFNWRAKDKRKLLIKWVGLLLVVVVLANLFYSMLRLSPYFHIINEKNTIFFYSFSEWIKHPFTNVIGNWSAQWDWFMKYFTLPVLFLIPLGFIVSKKYFFEKILLILWFLIPFTFLAFFGNTIYPRFIFFMTMPLLLLIAFMLYEGWKLHKNKYLLVIVLFLFFLLQLRSDYLILTDFGHAPIPVSDLGQYYKGWPAGEGVKESVAFFKEQARDNKIYIGTQGTFGLMPYAYELYLVNNPNVTIVGYWPTSDTVPKELREMSKTKDTYFVFYQPCPACNEKKGIAPTTWRNTTLIYQVKKQDKDSFLSVYKILPQE